MSTRRAHELFSEALAFEGAEQRAFIDEQCGDDDELRREVEKLMAPNSATLDKFFAPPLIDGKAGGVAAEGSGFDGDAPTLALDDFRAEMLAIPERLGHYRIIDRLGQGGMGTVFLAEQEHPVRRRVALKVINAFSEHQAERFALECQALARLGHPHIASLFEVGATAEGQPFVAMELVEGTTILEWCNEHRMGLRARIELFLGVCAGVRHAHEKGILHRDLKPSNILVTEVDGTPVAKVIDFGIARAVDNPLLETEKRLTMADQIVGSPIYMSPETILGERDADTRSDVHALGLILYQLLSGALPFDPDKDPLVVLLHQISTTDMPAPSVRFVALDGDLQEAHGETRNLSGSALRRRLQGDLDAIASKAIARDRNQRYSSPADLAADLRFYLEKRPVTARPAAATYVLRRYLQRHLGFVIAASALVLTLVAGIVSSTREAQRANLEARRALEAVEQARQEAQKARLAQAEAQEVSKFLVDLFELADPEKAPGHSVDAKTLFDRGVEKLRTELQDQPLARARLLSTVSEIYTKMALFGQAEALAVETLELRRERLPEDHEDVLRSVNQLGVIYRNQNRFDEAEPLLLRVARARETATPADPPALAQALNNLGNLYWSQNRLEKAVETHGRALEIRESVPDLDVKLLAESLNNLGVLQQNLRNYEDAEVYLQRADTAFIESLGPKHPIRAAVLNNLGMVEHRIGKWQRAEKHLLEAISIWQKAYGDSHPRTVSAKTNLAFLYRTLGRETESVRIFRGILADQESQPDTDPTDLAATLRRLGWALARHGELTEGQAKMERSFALQRRHRGEDHGQTIRSRSDLAWIAAKLGRFAEAESTHRKLLELRARTRGEESLVTATSQLYLAQALVGQGRDEEAKHLLERALEVRQTRLGESHDDVADVLVELGELEIRAGRLDAARSRLERAAQIYRIKFPPENPDAQRAELALASLDTEG